jgi:hypothetical protein
MLAEADAWKTARTKASIGALVDRWLAGHEMTFNGASIETGTDSYRLAHTIAQQAV